DVVVAADDRRHYCLIGGERGGERAARTNSALDEARPRARGFLAAQPAKHLVQEVYDAQWLLGHASPPSVSRKCSAPRGPNTSARRHGRPSAAGAADVHAAAAPHRLAGGRRLAGA